MSSAVPRWEGDGGERLVDVRAARGSEEGEQAHDGKHEHHGESPPAGEPTGASGGVDGEEFTVWCAGAAKMHSHEPASACVRGEQPPA